MANPGRYGPGMSTPRVRRLLFSLLAIAALPAVARAQIDMNGSYWVEVLPDRTSLLQVGVTQVGSTLTMSGDFVGSGIIDTTTGVFSVSFPSGPCFGISGTATNGGDDFLATFTGGTSLFCNFDVIQFAGSRHCHDGVVDAAAGEQCDPGAAIDKCCPSCLRASAGTTCVDDGNSCTRDECNAAGACIHPNRIAGNFCDSDFNGCTVDKCDGAGHCLHTPTVGLACNDANGCTSSDACDVDGVCRGTPCGPCSSCVLGSCTSTAAATDVCDQPLEPGSPLTLEQGSSPARATATWKLTHGPAATPADFGDPSDATAYALCVYRRPPPEPSPVYADVLLSAVLPGGATCADGKPCWKATKRGFKYQDKTGLRGGVTQLDLRAGKEGRTRLTLKSKGANLALPDLPIDGSVLVRLKADDGRCWQAVYHDPRKNDGSVFKADGAAHVQP